MTINAPEPLARRRILPAILLFAALGAGVMALRIVLGGENWLDRTLWLVGLSAFGGAGGAMFTILALRLFMRRASAHAPRPGAILATGIVFAASYLACMGLAFIFQNRVLGGQFEPHPDRLIRSALFSSLETAALFLYSISRYLLWWPFPVLILAAMVVLPAYAGARRVEKPRSAV